MAGLILRRVFALIPILLIVSFGVFMLSELVPGDPAVTLAGGDSATPERIAEIRDQLGFDEPLLQRYGSWLADAARFDFGRSVFAGESAPTVMQDIWSRLPVTLSIVGAGVTFSALIGVPLGVLAGLRPGSLLDRVSSTSIMVGLAIPNFLLALLLVWAFAIRFRWFPSIGFTPFTESPFEWLKSILLPGLALGMVAAASVGRQVRAALVEVVYSNYVRTAWAKGCSPMRAIGKHALKNAAIPAVTVLGLQISALIGGAVLVEQIFSLPGIGTYLLRALTNSDVPVIQGVVVFFVFTYVAVNLLVDISYGLLNPKVRVCEYARVLGDGRTISPASGAGGEQAPESAASIPVVATPSQARQVIRRLRRDKIAMGALCFVVVLAILAIFAPFVAPFDPNQTGAGPRFAGFGGDHWLGTDDLGRDTFSRLIYGARVSLRFSLQAVGIAVMIAVPFGLYAGYKGGLIDNAMMRVVDALASVPALILALALIGILGPDLNNAMLAIAVVMSPGFIRLIRAQALSVREETYIEASHSLGTRQRRILFHRGVAELDLTLIVAASIALGQALVAESGLSLLGFGMQPPDASWGSMLDRGRTVLNTEPLQVLIPGLALALTTLSFNLFGDGLSDAMGSSRQKGFKTVKGRLGLTTAPAGRSESPSSSGALLEVDGLHVEFLSPAGTLPVVEDVSFTINEGEVLGLVGESGSGKTVTSLSIMRLIPSPPGQIARGSISFDGTDLLSISSSEMRDIRGNDISMVFQDPMTSLNPAFTMGDQLVEAIRVHQPMKKEMAHRRALELLDLVGIPDPRQRMRDYPHQFSGGMRQRGLLAVALACEPRLLIADEPTTALDVTVQAQILELLKSLQRETGMAVLFVTHDLGVVADLCDRVAVMYAGQIVEQGPTAELFAAPEHPYTSGLLQAIPQLAQAGERLNSIPGVVPTPGAMPTGCRFQPRCPHAIEQCAVDPVQLLSSDGRNVRCVRAGQLDLSGTR